MMDKIILKKKKILVILFFCFLVFFYVLLYFLNLDIVQQYDNTFFPSVWVDGLDLSDVSFKRGEKLLEEYSSSLTSKKINVIVSSKEYSYSLDEMGIRVDVNRSIQSIQDYQKNLPFSRKLWFINKHSPKVDFNVYYSISKDEVLSFLQRLSEVVNHSPVDGHFDTTDGVRYVSGVNGFQLNISKSYQFIEEYFSDSVDDEFSNFILVGDSLSAYTNERYQTIDSMTSSFVTSYDTWVYARAQNLRVAINYINGAIVEPGEVFSYFDYAGPYDKEGYVFYYEFVGNGVCQVATTVYNSALLGGLEIVKRYPHKKKSVYVDGGLDATVASYDGWNVDMQWKNTYDYPIYVKAYDQDGEVHVEFWSNHAAKKDKTYSTESVWLGGRGYKTYLHTYQNGEEIDRSLIDTTWYLED